jgi:hypothetical protein
VVIFREAHILLLPQSITSPALLSDLSRTRFSEVLAAINFLLIEIQGRGSSPRPFPARSGATGLVGRTALRYNTAQHLGICLCGSVSFA